MGDVYLNGERVGGTDYGYVGFEIDVTDRLKFGQDNVIAVMADTREPGNSRWYTGGGLFRDVKLVATNRSLYFARHPLYITTRDNRFVTVRCGADKRRKERQTVWTSPMPPTGTPCTTDTETCRRITPSRTRR